MRNGGGNHSLPNPEDFHDVVKGGLSKMVLQYILCIIDKIYELLNIFYNLQNKCFFGSPLPIYP